MKKGKWLLTAMLCASFSATLFAAACQTEHTHSWGDWTIKDAPTLTEGGKAEHSCTDDNKSEEVNIPALSNSTVWTKDTEKSTPATHTAGGKDVYTSEYGEVEVATAPAGHSWSGWTITKEPTLEAAGTATRTCTANDGGSEEKTDVPALSDTAVWTKDSAKSTPAGHTTGGKDVYTSEYGEVEVATDPAGHSWGAWTWDTEPTLDTQGVATRTCTANDGGTETKTDVPALSDSSWTVKEVIPADYTHGTYTVYESVYGTVTVEEGEALSLPFANKTYHSFTLNAQNLNSSVYASNTNAAASITFNADGEGTGTVAPFDGKFTLSVVDYETGELSVTIENGDEPTVKKAYMHFDTGVIIMPVDDSFNNLLVLITHGAYDSGKETVTSSAWQVGEEFNFGIVYSVYGSGLPEYDHFIFIKDDVVHFDVTFSNINGQKLDSTYAGGSLYKEDYLYITDSNGEQLAAYGYNKAIANHVVLDGKEGTYTTTVGTDNASLFLSGYGTATLTVGGNKYNGTYAVAEGDYDMLLTMEEGHGEYKLTFGADKAVTLAAVKVNVTYNMNGHGEQLDGEEVLKNSPVELATPDEVSGWQFLGWYLEEDCSTPATNADGKALFNEGATVYAKWAQVLTITVDYGKEGLNLQTTYTVGDGEVLTVEVPLGICDGQAFEGFYTSPDFNPDDKWTNGSEVRASDEITTLYVKWITTVPYYGTYYGQEVWGANNPPSVSSGENSISIDTEGNANGKFGWNTKSGVIKQYDEETGAIIIEVSSSNYGGVVDIENGVIIYNYSAGETLTNDIYIMLRGKTGVTCDKTKVSQWNSGLTKLATFAYTGGEMIVFIWNGRVWGNVSISSADGSVTAGNAYSAESFSVVGSDGKTIAIFKDGDFVPTDGLDATYTGSHTVLGQVNIDGNGKITANEGALNGTYTITEDNTIEAIFTVSTANASTLSVYTIVLDKENKTYTATEKSVEKVTVTLIFAQDDLCEDEQVTFEIISGTTPDLSAYAPKGANALGNYFIGWYEDADRQSPYTSAELSENKTVYAGWLPYLVEEIVGASDTNSSHNNNNRPTLYKGWNYNDGTWRIDCDTTSRVRSSYVLKITFAKAGTFSFDWAASFTDTYNGSHVDFFAVGKNIASNWPHDQKVGTNLLEVWSGSGNKSIEVNAGDYLYFEAYWDSEVSYITDYAQISNFQFVAAD